MEPGATYVSTGEQLRSRELPNLEGLTVTDIAAPFMDESVEVVWTGIATAGPGGGVFGHLESWPPTEEERTRYRYRAFMPVDEDTGATVEDPTAEVEIVVVYEVPREAGRYLREGIVVDYEVDGVPHRLRLPARGLLCVDMQGECSWTDADQEAVEASGAFG